MTTERLAPLWCPWKWRNPQARSLRLLLTLFPDSHLQLLPTSEACSLKHGFLPFSPALVPSNHSSLWLGALGPYSLSDNSQDSLRIIQSSLNSWDARPLDLISLPHSWELCPPLQSDLAQYPLDIDQNGCFPAPYISIFYRTSAGFCQ